MKTTDRLIIEEISEAEFSELLKLYNKPNNMKFILTGKSDYNLEELKNKWDEHNYNPNEKIGFQIVKLKNNNEIIGECGLLITEKHSSQEVELAYMIDQKYWRQGFGTEICKFLINEAFENLKTKRILAGMYAENHNSIKLIEKLGFKLYNEGISKSGIHFREYELIN